jgi:hypothetical protein
MRLHAVIPAKGTDRRDLSIVAITVSTRLTVVCENVRQPEDFPAD